MSTDQFAGMTRRSPSFQRRIRFTIRAGIFRACSRSATGFLLARASGIFHRATIAPRSWRRARISEATGEPVTVFEFEGRTGARLLGELGFRGGKTSGAGRADGLWGLPARRRATQNCLPTRHQFCPGPGRGRLLCSAGCRVSAATARLSESRFRNCAARGDRWQSWLKSRSGWCRNRRFIFRRSAVHRNARLNSCPSRASRGSSRILLPLRRASASLRDSNPQVFAPVRLAQSSLQRPPRRAWRSRQVTPASRLPAITGTPALRHHLPRPGSR